jgi:4-hydroxybenzoate polyprenyltransferase
MKEFLTLIRWKNLLIVTITMVLMRYFVIAPLLSQMSVILVSEPDTAAQMMLRLPWYEFIMLVFATVCLTAAGYVINDYFDIKTDLINRGKVIVGAGVSRRKAMMWHSIFNIAGVAAGFYISARAGYFWMGVLFILVSGLLYFYSASYKRQFLIGNIIVAVLTALVPLLVIFYEWPALYKYYSLNAASVPSLTVLFYWVGGFALFAFITTLSREIIKDIEDFEGDMAYGRNTLPVITGIPASKIIAVSLVSITIAMLFLIWFFYLRDWITLAYVSVAIVVPLALVIFYLVSGTTRKRVHSASNLMKIAMLTGILYSLVVKAIITWHLL